MLPTQAVLRVTDYFKCGFSGQTFCYPHCDNGLVILLRLNFESNATDGSWVLCLRSHAPPKVVQTAHSSRVHELDCKREDEYC